MRRALNGVLAVGVAALVAVAALDALGRDDAPPAGPGARTGLRGALVWSDPGCRRHAVTLPELARRAFRTVGCGVFTRRDNLGVVDGEVAWFAYPGAGGSTTVLDRGALRSQVGRHFRIRSVAWLGGTRFAALLEGPNTLVTTWQGPSMRSVEVVADRFTAVRASGRGRWFAALGGGRVRLYGRNGSLVAVGPARAVAWSPDERWVALARPGAVEVLPVRGGRLALTLAVDAVDLDWRGEE